MSLVHVLMAGAEIALRDLIEDAYPTMRHLWNDIEQCEFCKENKAALEAGACVLPPAGDLTHMLPRFWDEGPQDQSKLAAMDRELENLKRRRDAAGAKAGAG